MLVTPRGPPAPSKPGTVGAQAWALPSSARTQNCVSRLPTRASLQRSISHVWGQRGPLARTGSGPALPTETHGQSARPPPYVQQLEPWTRTDGRTGQGL